MSGRKGKKHEHVNHERWLVSYADFITLLFAFFVVMFAVGQTDRSKLERFVSAVNVAFRMDGMFSQDPGNPMVQSGAGGNSMLQQFVFDPPSMRSNGAISPEARAVRQSLERSLEEERPSIDVELRYDARGVVVSLSDWALFLPGSARLRPEAEADLLRLGQLINDQPILLRIEAFTAALEVSEETFDSANELGAARTARLARFLLTEARFDPRKLQDAGPDPYLVRESLSSPEKERHIELVLLTEKPAEETAEDE